VKQYLPTSLKDGLSKLALLLAGLIIFWSPFSGGPRPITLLLTLLGLVYVGVMRASLWQNIAVKRWTLVFIALWAPMCLSLINTFNAKTTLIAIAWFPVFYLAGIALLYGLNSHKKRTWLNWFFIGTIGLWLLDSAVQYVFGKDLIGVPMSVDGRVRGFFTDLHQGLIILAVLPMAYYCLIEKNKVYASYALLIGCGLVMALAGARNYIYVLVLILMGIIFYEKFNLKKSLLLIGLPILVTAAAFGMSRQLIQMKIDHTEHIQEQSATTYEKINLALSYRLNIWETGYRMFLASPVTGIGSKNFKPAYPTFATRAEDPFLSTGIHAHNIFVEWMAETGLVGLAGLLLIAAKFRKWYSQAAAENQIMAWPYALSLIAIFFPINTTAPMMIVWWFPVLMLLACGYIASLNADSE
jgi:O-antigen ligase